MNETKNLNKEAANKNNNIDNNNKNKQSKTILKNEIELGENQEELIPPRPELDEIETQNIKLLFKRP